MKTIEQLRAEDALARAKGLEAEPTDLRKRYRSYVERMGPAILMNGLGQALAAELAAAGTSPKDDGEKAHRRLYEAVQDWLCRGGGVYPSLGDVLGAITEGDQEHYVRAQAEALAWLEWHKKFCRAFLPSGEAE
jgi:CRISPR-associated protein Cmr5